MDGVASQSLLTDGWDGCARRMAPWRRGWKTIKKGGWRAQKEQVGGFLNISEKPYQFTRKRTLHVSMAHTTAVNGNTIFIRVHPLSSKKIRGVATSLQITLQISATLPIHNTKASPVLQSWCLESHMYKTLSIKHGKRVKGVWDNQHLQSTNKPKNWKVSAHHYIPVWKSKERIKREW